MIVGINILIRSLNTTIALMAEYITYSGELHQALQNFINLLDQLILNYSSIEKAFD